MVLSGRLGSLAISDDSSTRTALPDFKQIMSIEGSNFADFRYETFDPSHDDYDGVKSSISLKVGSLKLQFLEKPLHEVYCFVLRLAKLKGLYDAATQAAVQSASEIERMQFEVSVMSPVIVFPSNAYESTDVLVLRLGEMNARNSYEGDSNKTTASLTGIQLASSFKYGQNEAQLKIVDDIGITADVIQTTGINRDSDTEYPDTQVTKVTVDSLCFMLRYSSGCYPDIGR